MLSGFGHLAWDSTREKNGSMKKTEQHSRANPHNSGTKPKLTREATGKKKQHGKHTSINMAYDAQTSMMHVRFKYAWHGKVHKQVLQVKWSSICNELHIDETPHLII